MMPPVLLSLHLYPCVCVFIAAIATNAAAEDSTAAPESLPGCFVDFSKNRSEARQLPTRACFIRGPLPNDCAHLSRELCGQLCRQLGHAIAGVEASHECTCGDTLSFPAKRAPSAECNEPCTGNPEESCGGTRSSGARATARATRQSDIVGFPLPLLYRCSLAADLLSASYLRADWLVAGSFRLWAFNASSVGPAPPVPPRPHPTPLPPPGPPPGPPDPFYRPIFHTPADNPPGYVGDANGMMFRRVPWNSSSDGQYHPQSSAPLPTAAAAASAAPQSPAPFPTAAAAVGDTRSPLPHFRARDRRPARFLNGRHVSIAAGGLFHLFWQAEFVHGLWWGHAVSRDYVRRPS